MASMAFKGRSWVKNVISDPGNYPLLAANFVGLTMLVVFGSRKIFTHPDSRVSIEERSISDVTPTRAEDAQTFRKHSGFFGTALAPLADALHSITLSGRGRRDDFWHKAKLNTPVPTPLEHTNYFEDGLFKGAQPAVTPTGVMHAKDDTD